MFITPDGEYDAICCFIKMSEKLHNWAGNFRYSAARVHHPQNVDQVREIVARAEKVKGLGTRHSFNEIADCAEDLISLSQLDRVVEIDRDRRTVTVEAGMKYGQLGEYLNGAGYAVRNMASLPHISVAGACATGTHGSGDGNGNLATAVVGMEMVNADGEVIEFSRERDGEQFDGMVIGLGGMGIVTKLTLEIVPSFLMRQDVYENLTWKQLEEYYEAIAASDYSVSLFTDWQSDRVNQVWLKQTVGERVGREPAPTFLGATLARGDRHPIASASGEHRTSPQGVVGPWHERLPHFRMGFVPSSGEELQSEYFVPRRNATAAFAAVARLRDKIGPLLIVSELRTIASDNLWMSPCYGQACSAIHFTWKADWPRVQNVLPLIEAELAPLGARPHWGKLFTMAPARLGSLYARLADFRQLLMQFDPRGKFRNAFLDRYIFGQQ
jgi:alditol oxidase